MATNEIDAKVFLFLMKKTIRNENLLMAEVKISGARQQKHSPRAGTLQRAAFEGQNTGSRKYILVKNVRCPVFKVRSKPGMSAYSTTNTLCLKKTGPLLHFQITPTILVQYQQILV